MQSKYFIWYNQIIDAAIVDEKNRKSGYYEKHHIIPRSVGGSNDQYNIAKLTAREHFICHALLTKFTSGQLKHKMIYAFNMMGASNNNQERYMNSRIFESNKKKAAKLTSERNKELYKGEGNPNFGKSSSKRVQKFWDSVDEQWRMERNKNVSEGTKLAIKNMSNEKKEEIRQKREYEYANRDPELKAKQHKASGETLKNKLRDDITFRENYFRKKRESHKRCMYKKLINTETSYVMTTPTGEKFWIDNKRTFDVFLKMKNLAHSTVMKAIKNMNYGEITTIPHQPRSTTKTSRSRLSGWSIEVINTKTIGEQNE
jgi:hypothetical protein